MAQFQIIQLKDPASPSTLQFPITPLEAIVHTVDTRATPAFVVLTQFASSLSAPTAQGQKAYSTTDHMVHTSETSNGSLVWDYGDDPEPGVLYSWNGKFYGVRRDEWGDDSLQLLSMQVTPYTGPFAVIPSWGSYTVVDRTEGGSFSRAGYIVSGTTYIEVPMGNVSLNNGDTLYILVYRQNSQITSRFQTDTSTTGITDPICLIRLATKVADWGIIQAHFGDIILPAL